MDKDELDSAEIIAAVREGLKPLVDGLQEIISKIDALSAEVHASREQSLRTLETPTTKSVQ
jgi:hypothetical protein